MSSLNEFTAKELIKNSIRKKSLQSSEYSNTRPVKYLHRTKNFVFKIKDYEVNIRLEDFPVISKLKGSDEEKLELALAGDIKVGCTCPDYSYGGWKYIGTQLDYSTHRENRPPDIRNPKQEGTVCKHIGHILSNINNFKPKMLELMDKSRKNNYKVVTEGTTSNNIGTFIQHDYDFVYPNFGYGREEIENLINSEEEVKDIVNEFTKLYRMRSSYREDIPDRIIDLKFGDVLFFEDDSDFDYRYERYLVVKNSANKDYSICWDYDENKFHVIINSHLKNKLLGRSSSFDPTLAQMLRAEYKDTILNIEREPKLYFPWT